MEENNKVQDVKESDSTSGANAADASAKKKLTTRGILLIGIGGLLVALLIIGAAAWYTRISVVNQISMDAAQFDFKANYSDQDFIIRAEDYTNVYGTNKTAPGTAGVIPVLVQAGDSNVDVNYILKFNTSNMDDNFKRRIRFFYIPKEDVGKAWNGTTYDPSFEKEFNSESPIVGTLVGTPDTNGENNITGEQHYEYIYWEWVYDLDPHRYYSENDKKWYISDSNDYKDQFNTEYTSEAVTEFDKFDTKIGRGDYDDKYTAKYGNTTKDYKAEPMKYYAYDEETKAYKEIEGTVKAYQQAMEIKVDITGAMATPTYNDDTHGVQNPSTGNYGSGYVDLTQVINQHNLAHLGAAEEQTEESTE